MVQRINSAISRWAECAETRRSDEQWRQHWQGGEAAHDELTAQGITATVTALLDRYTPGMQSAYCSSDSIRDCYNGNHPTLSGVAKTHGSNIAGAWVLIQLQDLANFSNVSEKLNEMQLLTARDIIMQDYSFMKLTEIMHFFWLFKKGEYGLFYGAVDAIAILRGLREFHLDKWHKLSRKYSHEKELAERKMADDAESKRKDCFRRWLKACGKTYFDENDIKDFEAYYNNILQT